MVIKFIYAVTIAVIILGYYTSLVYDIGINIGKSIAYHECGK